MSANNPERADKTECVRKNIAVRSDHQPETAVNHTPKTSLFEVSLNLSVARGKNAGMRQPLINGKLVAGLAGGT